MKLGIIKTILCTATIATCAITAIAVNADNALVDKANPEFAEISKAVEASQMIDNLSSEFIVNGEVVKDKRTSVFGLKNEPEYDMDSAVRIYALQDIKNLSSHTDRYYYVVPVKQGKDIIALVTMSKGESLAELQPYIDSLNMSDKKRTDLMKNVSEREGKWYAMCMEEISSEMAYIFDENSVANQLKKNDITSVQDMMYFRYDDTFLLKIKTDNGDYIMPTQLSSINNLKFDKKAYSMVEFSKVVNVK